jgi:aflatoxin B1 aldehyde reductase
LATKHYPFEPGQHTEEKLRAALDTSLAALKTKTVDIFYLHAADRSVGVLVYKVEANHAKVPFQETLAAVNKMHKEGKFVNLGLSNYTAFEVAEVCILCKANGWVRPTIWQGKFCALRSCLMCQECTTPSLDPLKPSLSLLAVVTASTL